MANISLLGNWEENNMLDDIKIENYLTYAQVQAIANSAKNAENWAEKQQDIDMLLMHYATDITDEELSEKGHDYWLKTGFIDKVKSSIVNYKDVDTAIAYEENPIRILIKISNEIPEFSKKMNELLEVSGNANGKK